MIALWMLLAVVVGALVALAAAGAERALRLVGRPARWAWAAALALTLALPMLSLPSERGAAARALPAGGRAALDPAILALAGRSAGGGAVTAWLADGAIAAPRGWHRLDRPLLVLWLAASALLALRTAVAARRLRTRMRGWPEALPGGTPVRVAPDLGPAVFGALRPAVILPRWALADARLPLMLAHEAAHVRARDPLLLAAGLAAAVLVPWNPAAWWQLRRLRLAVELDCDARVLAADGARPAAVHDYGTLLLDVARRAPATGWLATATLSPTLLATPSTLTKRIHAMTTPRLPHAARRALPPAAGAALLVAAACEMPRPTGPRAEPHVAIGRLAEQSPARAPVGRPVTADDLREVVRLAMPGALHERRGATQRLWIVQDADGRVRSVMRGTADATPGADRLGMRDVTLAEAANGGFVVRVAEAGAAGSPARVAADAIGSVDVLKLGAGRVLPDSTEAIWMRLKGTGTAATSVRPDTTRAPTRVGIRTTTGPTPLYVIDGVEYADAKSAESALPKPDRIAAVNVLKGATATRKYGTRGANGVVEITTNR